MLCFIWRRIVTAKAQLNENSHDLFDWILRFVVLFNTVVRLSMSGFKLHIEVIWLSIFSLTWLR